MYQAEDLKIIRDYVGLLSDNLRSNLTDSRQTEQSFSYHLLNSGRMAFKRCSVEEDNCMIEAMSEKWAFWAKEIVVILWDAKSDRYAEEAK